MAAAALARVEALRMAACYTSHQHLTHLLSITAAKCRLEASTSP